MKIRQNHIDYGYRKTFDAKEFLNPALNYWPAYSWIWNGDLTKEGIRQQLDTMVEENIRAVYVLPEPDAFRPDTMHTHMSPDYLTEEYFELYRFAVEYARSKDMQLWLYDEAGWPSGFCNGEVVKRRPELIDCRMTARKKDWKAGEEYQKPTDALAAFRSDNTLIDGCYTPEKDETVTEYVVASCTSMSNPHPALMNPETTKEFLKLTHERYKAHMGDLFGDNFKITFTDEPSISQTAWIPGLEQLFEERYGYSFIPYLPAIVTRADMGEKGRVARMDFCDLASELFAVNYFQGLQNWCRDNDMLSAGHVNGEDDTIGCVDHEHTSLEVLRVLRCFDIPGVDTIWRQIFPKEPDYRNGHKEAPNLFFPRYASSAARQASSRATLSESYAIYGAGVTCDQMRYVMNFQAVRGINIFNVMNLTYCQDRHFMAGARPTFNSKMPGVPDRRAFHEYVARHSYLTFVGEAAIDTALYMPIRDFWACEDVQDIASEFERIGLTMERLQADFDIFDDDVLASADPAGLKEGKIKIGYATYQKLILPSCRRISDAGRAILEEYVRGGGKCYYVIGSIDPEIRGEIRVRNIEDIVCPLVRTDNRDIRVTKHVAENGSLYLLYNEGFTSTIADIHFDESGNVRILDENTGALYDGGHCSENGYDTVVTLKCGEGLVVFFTQDDLDAVPMPKVFEREFCRLEDFSFRKTYRFTIGKTCFETETITEPEIAVKTGDWRTFCGEEFSGSGIYCTTFQKPDAGECMIDFGEVDYTCEVFVNGVNKGILCTSPYCVRLTADELKDDNVLEVRVSNTAANQYVTTKNFDQFSQGELGPYHKTTLTFEAESMQSGLIGPVRILV